MPNRTTIRISLIELSALRLNALLAMAMRPSATWETTPIVITGSRATTGLLKITSSSTMMSRMVASPTMAWARFPDFCESNC
jgi:hypothetical protein